MSIKIEEEKTEENDFDIALRKLCIKHKIELFYVTIDTDGSAHIGTNTCIRCLKPLVESFFSEVEGHSQEDYTKH